MPIPRRRVFRRATTAEPEQPKPKAEPTVVKEPEVQEMSAVTRQDQEYDPELDMFVIVDDEPDVTEPVAVAQPQPKRKSYKNSMLKPVKLMGRVRL